MRSLLPIVVLLAAAPSLAEEALRVAPGEAADHVVGYGESVVVEGETSGDAVSYGSHVEIVGVVRGKAVAFGGDLIVRGEVQGDALAYGGNVVLMPGAKVNGRVTAVGGEILRSASAQVHGPLAAVGGSTIELADAAPGSIRNALLEAPRAARSGVQEWLLRFLVIFGLGFLAHLTLPRRLHAMELEVRRQPARAGLIGFFAFLLCLPLSILFSATVIGIPVALALWFLLFASVALGAASAVQALGRIVPGFRRRRKKMPVLAAGAAVLASLGLVPWLAVIVYFAFAFIGLGAAIATRFGKNVSGLPAPLEA